MPGIVGIISQGPTEECQRLIKSMISSMQHEAFYSSGSYCAPAMGVYVGWVAHEHSFAAGQVFLNEKQDIALIFAGECFVDVQTLADLKQSGHMFNECGGDWLVHLYEEKGDQFFEKLNGLFSGLLIDKRQRKSFLFNDRYGVERIYLHQTADATYFASEAKALLCILPELRAFDEDAIVQFLAYGCPLEGRTLFRGVELLPGGLLWCFEGRKSCKTRYFSPEIWESQAPLQAESFISMFEETFKTILPRFFQSPKIGMSLTGGLDGRMILACRPHTPDLPICYTFCGLDKKTLDAEIAGRVAKVCGLDHKILRLDEAFFTSFAFYADRTVYVTDGSLGPLGAHEIYLNRHARELAPVRLTGVFGGEIFREVSMFKPIRPERSLLNPHLAESLDCFVRDWRPATCHPTTFAAFREIPQKRFGPPAASRSQLVFRTPFLDNELVALAYRIPATLRKSPSPAYALIKNNNPTLSKIPTDMGELGNLFGWAATCRRLARKATFKLDYFYGEGLPHWFSGFDAAVAQFSSGSAIFGRHKFLHYRRWFRQQFAAYLRGALENAQMSAFWNRAFLDQMAEEHISGRKNYVGEIDLVLTLEAVERLFFKGLSRTAPLSLTG